MSMKTLYLLLIKENNNVYYKNINNVFKQCKYFYLHKYEISIWNNDFIQYFNINDYTIFKLIDYIFSNNEAREKEKYVNNNSFYTILFIQFIECFVYYLFVFNIYKINTCLINFINVFSIVYKRNFHSLIFRYVYNVINIFL